MRIDAKASVRNAKFGGVHNRQLPRVEDAGNAGEEQIEARCRARHAAAELMQGISGCCHEETIARIGGEAVMADRHRRKGRKGVKEGRQRAAGILYSTTFFASML
ncbi:hypothetical protein GCM10007205_01270 [Oxalicibacterium flavum]|uniref:Uncharacterized protein n=1 Tax=Oxalicibacterium flavum TaxID=179467 RepID=A0A8J2UNE2_9BURK|nr:hypothetical protein GCM10007205_01270 [Oxalicibacterium flavum]